MIVPLPVEFHWRKLRDLFEHFYSIPPEQWQSEFDSHAALFREQKIRHAWLAFDSNPFAGFNDD